MDTPQNPFARYALMHVRAGRSDFTLRQLALLWVLAHPDSLINVREAGHTGAIARVLRISKPVVTRATNALEQLNMVKREKLEHDHRLVRIVLTDYGREYIKEYL